MEPTHASFFSGVGGLDLGLERAGWGTVSFSEIDPYASAVLAERWPGVPNLGDIVRLAERPSRPGDNLGHLNDGRPDGIPAAILWTGGFPCQDLSVAGKRAGFAGERSVLAFAFLDLVERYRPPAVLLENVPGLLSSHRGRDMAALLGRLVELGYGVAYRVLDARHFGVPQRRRRVFILGLRSDPDDPDGRVAAERAAAVLSVGARCRRHPPTGVEAGEEPAAGVGVGISHALAAHHTTGRLDSNGETFVGPQIDPRGVRAPDGMAGRLDDRSGLAATLNSGGNNGGFPTEPGEHLVAVSENQRGELLLTDQAHQLTAGGGKPGQAYSAAFGAFGVVTDDPLLPLGLDSHRYRCCGNGVVAPVAEWIGARLLAALERA